MEQFNRITLFTRNFNKARGEVEERGGRVTKKLSPNVLVAVLPDNVDRNSLLHSNTKPPVDMEIDIDTQKVIAALEANKENRTVKSPKEGLYWNDPNHESP